MQPIRCPACNKSDLTSAQCPRCGCDLMRLHEINRAAAQSLARSLACLRNQDWEHALHHAARSWGLRHHPQAARVAFLAAAAQGDTELALGWRACAEK